MSLTVYISSTQRDLISERKKLKECLEMAGYAVMCMEIYPAFSEPPEIRCKEDVSACDIYICLTGERYGDKPTGSDKSYTEHEYLAALASNKEIFIFTKAVPAEEEELKTFKESLQKRHGMLPPFTTETDLANKVLVSLLNSELRKKWAAGKQHTAINTNLKYLCDREPQSAQLSAKRREIDEGKALVFSLEGYTKNRHRSFIARLKNEAAKSKAGADNNLLMFLEINLKVEGCNNGAAVSARILNTIFDDLDKKGVSVAGKPTYATLGKIFQNNPYKMILIVIYVQESSINGNVEKMKKYKEGIAVFTSDVQGMDIPNDSSMLFCICLEQNVKEELPDIVSSIESIERLPVLTDISTGDVEHWLATNNIETDFDKIQNIIKTIYKDGVVELPLGDVEKELDIIIHAYNSQPR